MVVDDREGRDRTGLPNHQSVLLRAAEHKREWVGRQAGAVGAVGVAGMGMRAQRESGGVGWAVALE